MSDAAIPFPSEECSRTWVRDLAWFIGETARPMSMGLVATSTAAGFLLKMDVGALGVMSALVGTLYGSKVFEKVQQTKADAEVKKAGVTA